MRSNSMISNKSLFYKATKSIGNNIHQLAQPHVENKIVSMNAALAFAVVGYLIEIEKNDSAAIAAMIYMTIFALMTVNQNGLNRTIDQVSENLSDAAIYGKEVMTDILAYTWKKTPATLKDNINSLFKKSPENHAAIHAYSSSPEKNSSERVNMKKSS